MLATGLKIDLPQAKQALPLNPKEPVVITIAKDARLSLGSDVIGKDQLIAAVHDKLEGDMNRTIHLRGDKEVPFGDIVAIMDLLASNGLTHIAIVADARTKPDIAPLKPAVSLPVGNGAGPDTANVKPASGQPVVADPRSGVEGGAK
jgi:biopolymer transport protein ExbD